MTSANEFLERCDLLMMGQAPRTILQKAYETIKDPARWTTGAMAVDENNRRVRPNDERAVRWDVEGAVAIASNPYGILAPFFMKLLDEVAEEYGMFSIGALNDSFQHERVLAVLQEAIDRCP